MSSCLSCGAQLPAGARFCPACGASVEALPAPISAEERRVVTILFADVSGFTSLAERLDPEDVKALAHELTQQMGAEVGRFGGTVISVMGDAIMAVFGAPVAHEDDAERAVRAALAMRESIRSPDDRFPTVQLHIGINTGEGMAGLVGPESRRDYTVMGDVTNTASRLQSAATAGEILVGEVTRRTLRDRFEVEALPPATVKGKSEPLTVWRIVRELDAPAGPGLAPSAIVGREQELMLLQELFDSAVGAPSVRVVALVGEPGLGKTRLVDELQRRVGLEARCLTGYCLPYGEGVAFAPVADTVRTFAAVEPSDHQRVALERLVALAERVEDDPAERRWLVSRLASVLGVGGQEDDVTIPVGEIADAWARILAASAAERPLLLVIEDLHWADPALVELVEAAGDRLVGQPILLLVTARPDLIQRHARWGADRSDTTTIALAPLREEDTALLLSSLLAQAGLESQMQSQLLERSGGNPLYALEFVRMLGDSAEQTIERLGTPETVHAVIAARLDATPTHLRSLVQDASVLGEEFWAEALAAVGDQPETHVREGIFALVRRGLVEPWVATSVAGRQAYGFTHALIREVAYGRLPRSERTRRPGGRRVDRAREWRARGRPRRGARPPLRDDGGSRCRCPRAERGRPRPPAGVPVVDGGRGAGCAGRCRRGFRALRPRARDGVRWQPRARGGARAVGPHGPS